MLSGKSNAWYRKEPAWGVGHRYGGRIALQGPPQARRYGMKQILKFQIGDDRVVDVENQP